MEFNPQEEAVVKRFDESRKGGVALLLRSSIYCTALAALFLYLTLARNQPLYAIGIFAMFVLYLAIRIYTARQVAGIMPRILQRYERRITELEERLRKIDNDKVD